MLLAVTQDNAGQAALTQLQEGMDALIETIRIPEDNSTVSPDEPVSEPDRETMLGNLEGEVRKLESFLLPAVAPATAENPAANTTEPNPVVPGS